MSRIGDCETSLAALLELTNSFATISTGSSSPTKSGKPARLGFGTNSTEATTPSAWIKTKSWKSTDITGEATGEASVRLYTFELTITGRGGEGSDLPDLAEIAEAAIKDQQLGNKDSGTFSLPHLTRLEEGRFIESAAWPASSLVMTGTYGHLLQEVDPPIDSGDVGAHP